MDWKLTKGLQLVKQLPYLVHPVLRRFAHCVACARLAFLIHFRYRNKGRGTLTLLLEFQLHKVGMNITRTGAVKICIAIGAASPAQLEEAILKARPEADYLELRLDYLKA